MILYIDGAVRTESRTRELADYLIGKKSDKVEYVRLNEEYILPLKENILSKRNEACQKGDFSDPYFRYAKQFAAADEIVIVAPYWDFSLPSLVKAYPGGVTDPDYCVLKFTASKGRYYANFKSESFIINS